MHFSRLSFTNRRSFALCLVVCWITSVTGVAFQDDSGSSFQGGFAVADADDNGSVSEQELADYLSNRAGDLPFSEVFEKLDGDSNGSLNEEEFENRFDVLQQLSGGGSGGGMGPEDPGPGYRLYNGLNKSIDDGKVFGAVFNRHMELMEELRGDWDTVSLDDVPSIAPAEIARQLKALSGNSSQQSTEQLIKATAVIGSGGGGLMTAGCVIASADGLALTNFHVAEMMANSQTTATTHDGKTHRVTEFIAGNRDSDLAIVRLDGNDFEFVPIAASLPGIGSDLQMVHHSENRFYTYDRGYLMRSPVIGGVTKMEVSMDYAPGGSGCGIYDHNGHLVGLVSVLTQGDGPTLSKGMMDGPRGGRGSGGSGPPDLLVKHAVSLVAIRDMLFGDTELVERKVKTDKPESQQVSKERYEKNELVVTVTAPKTAQAGDEIELKLSLEIPEGQHLYGAADKGCPTEIKVGDDSGFQVVDTQIPNGSPNRKSDGSTSYWLTDRQTILQTIKLSDKAQGQVSIDGAINFTICTEKLCKPPAEIQFSSVVNVKPSTTAVAKTARSYSFKKPVQLKADGEVISVEAPGYAAPCVADIDNDGFKDLLVGQFGGGKIMVYPNTGSGQYGAGQWLNAGDDVASVPGVW